MKILPYALSSALVVAVGCASTSPLDYTTGVPHSRIDAFECALTQVNRLGFTVQQADRESGLIRAVYRQSSKQALSKALVGGVYEEDITVSIFNSTDHSSQVRLTADELLDKTEGLGAGGQTSMGLSKKDRANLVSNIVTPCAGSQATSAF